MRPTLTLSSSKREGTSKKNQGYSSQECPYQESGALLIIPSNSRLSLQHGAENVTFSNWSINFLRGCNTDYQSSLAMLSAIS